jgi:hypothetical protein
MRVIADRIGVLAGLLDQFGGIRDELPRDRIVGIVRIDQRGDIGCHRNRVARGDFLEIGERRCRRKASFDELGGLAQRSSQFSIDLVHASPAGGVHTT